jgi:hypothetical protein
LSDPRARSADVVGMAAPLAVALAAALGALVAACETVDLGAPPSDVNACRPSQQFFIDEIWPNVLSADYGGKHCYDSKCHDAASGRPLTLVVPPANEPAAIPLPPTWAKNYRSATEQMNCANPSSSDLILLPTNTRTHGGGQLFKTTDPEALSIQMWVTVP